MKAKGLFKLAFLMWFLPESAFAVAFSPSISDCAKITDDRQRLACYDRYSASLSQQNATESFQHVPDKAVRPINAAVPALIGEKQAKSSFSLDRHWELEPRYSHEPFSFRPHNGNYILFANYTSSPNSAPFSPYAGLGPQDSELKRTEVKFQLSFKMKLLDDLAATPADVWFGYTQESFWQLYNREASRPFRETDYQPELMLVMPVNISLLGMQIRHANLGFVHQSNGRGLSLSRSWNRLYAQMGLEKSNLTVTGRLWKRLKESSSEDDNPDITDYMGRGDVVAAYRWNGHVFSALSRYNFDTHRGAARLGWEFPIRQNIKGYLEAFSGYGQSLIDYNHSQKTIGMWLLFSN